MCGAVAGLVWADAAVAVFFGAALGVAFGTAFGAAFGAGAVFGAAFGAALAGAACGADSASRWPGRIRSGSSPTTERLSA